MNPISSKIDMTQYYIKSEPSVYEHSNLSAQKTKDFKNNSDSADEKAISEFESLFIHFLIKTMRQTVVKSDLLHQTKGEDTYYSLFDMEIAKEISKQKGIGLHSLISSGFEQNKKMNTDR